MGGSVRRWLAAAAAIILALSVLLLAGSCDNPLNFTLATWAQLDMVKVPGGSLWLGSDDVNYPDENWSHWTTVTGFLMSRYEVTQQLYSAVMADNPSIHNEDPAKPVDNVTWLEAVHFCNELSVYAGFIPCYDTTNELSGIVTCNFFADGYRLPTEAEWEYAARGGAGATQYLYSGSNVIGDVAWYALNSEATTHPVGSRAANDLGLYDMTGNVWEWCWDTHDDMYYRYPAEIWTDPLGPKGIYAYDALIYTVWPNYMSARGGSFVQDTTVGLDGLRTSARAFVSDPWVASGRDIVGFRVVRRP